jgi:hypothetical protein
MPLAILPVHIGGTVASQYGLKSWSGDTTEAIRNKESKHHPAFGRKSE